MLLLALLGCQPWPTYDFDVEGAISRTGGCGDVFLFGADADDSVLLTVEADGLLAAATDAGEPTTTSFVLPDDGVAAVLELGVGVGAAACNDVAVDATVDHTYTATSGTVTLVVTPTEDGLGKASATLEDVTMTAEDGDHTIVVLSLSLPEAGVGWLPG